MNGLTYSHTEGVVEAAFEHSGRSWSGIGGCENEALSSLLQTMALDFDFAARAPMGFDIEEFLAEAAGRNDALACETERLQDRVEELEVLNAIMAQQYGDEIARVVHQRDAARGEAVNLRIRNANLADRLELHTELTT